MSTTIDQEIYNMAIAEGFSPISAKLVVAQARLESADYGSNVFNNNNNMYGMKYVGQPLATRGTLAPYNERSSSCQNGGICSDRDHYAKYKSPQDSAKDVITRLYKKERKGIGFEQLRNVADADEFATKLKTRNYFGFHEINTSEGKAEANKYALMLKAKLIKINIIEFYNTNKKTINYSLIGLTLIGISIISFWYYRNKFLK
jgi:predicted CopG family antitoxin